MKTIPSTGPETTPALAGAAVAAAPTEDDLNLPTVLPDPLSTAFFPTSASGVLLPNQPRNVSVEKMAQGWVVSWLPPNHPEASVAHYRVQYKEGEADWVESEVISKDNAYLGMDTTVTAGAGAGGVEFDHNQLLLFLFY